MDDDAESIIISERYKYIESIIKSCVTKKNKASALTTSDKIDRIVTNRFLALPIFAIIMWAVYYIAMVTVGAAATDWANDGLFGDGFHLFGIGNSAFEKACEEFGDSPSIVEAYENGENFYVIMDEETLEISQPIEFSQDDVLEAQKMIEKYSDEGLDAQDFGIWVPGIPSIIESGLDKINCATWLKGLILDGIVAGVGAVLGFVPQMLVLFLLLAFLEACGYMARIAFIMDRVFRRFGLSGKSFIPMLVGTGCGIPGIMASRTIESERDRRMTIMTTTFIPCGAKTPFIAMIAGAIFGGSAWIATSAYFIGIASILISGIMLKKTKMFSGDVSPFVMELPAYHVPQPKNLAAHLWDKTKHFVKKAFTIILASTILIWFVSHFSWTWQFLADEKMDQSILAGIGGLIQPLFTPLGFGSQLKAFGWVFAVAAITGLIAKENVIATFGTLAACIVGGMIDVEADGGVGAAVTMIQATGITVPGLIAFIAFNMLTIPCFAAVATAKAELPTKKSYRMTLLFWFGTSYIVSMMIYLIGAWWWTVFIFAAIWAAVITLIVLDNKGKIDVKKFFRNLGSKLKIKKNA